LKIAVCICPAYESNAHITLTADSAKPEITGALFVLNSFDEYAIEEALKTRDNFGGTVDVLTVGNEQNIEWLRKALAMGADEAILIEAGMELNSQNTANFLSQEILSQNYDIVFMGRQTIDFQSGVVGQLTAEMCNYNFIASCTFLKIDGKRITGTREVENGTETITTSLPAIITANKGLNEPRYPSLKGIMAAKKKTIARRSISISPIGNIPAHLSMEENKKEVRMFENSSTGIQSLLQTLKKEGRF